MVRRFATLGAAAAVLAGSPLAAQEKLPPQPPSYAALTACRALADAERLACYDRAVATLATAVEQREVVITDRAAVREARRGLFGLTLPSLRLFGGGDGDEDIDEIETTIAALNGSVVVLADGARWRQTDGRPLRARAGTPIRIRRGAMSGYVAEVRGNPWVRVARLPD